VAIRPGQPKGLWERGEFRRLGVSFPQNVLDNPPPRVQLGAWDGDVTRRRVLVGTVALPTIKPEATIIGIIIRWLLENNLTT